MLLICIGLFIRRFMILEKRKKASVQEIFAAIFEVLTVGGLPASYSLLTENLEDEILERFVWIQEPELHRVLEIVLRTTYGRRRPQKRSGERSRTFTGPSAISLAENRRACRDLPSISLTYGFNEKSSFEKGCFFHAHFVPGISLLWG